MVVYPKEEAYSLIIPKLDCYNVVQLGLLLKIRQVVIWFHTTVASPSFYILLTFTHIMCEYEHRALILNPSHAFLWDQWLVFWYIQADHCHFFHTSILPDTSSFPHFPPRASKDHFYQKKSFYNDAFPTKTVLGNSRPVCGRMSAGKPKRLWKGK